MGKGLSEGCRLSDLIIRMHGELVADRDELEEELGFVPAGAVYHLLATKISRINLQLENLEDALKEAERSNG